VLTERSLRRKVWVRAGRRRSQHFRGWGARGGADGPGKIGLPLVHAAG